MKGLLIFLAIYLVEVIVQKIRQKKREKEEQAQQQANLPPDYSEGQTGSNRNLQDLIRQFEDAQRQASQGNIEPPLPPSEEYEEVELPVVSPREPGRYTFKEIAESVIQWEYVSVDLLQQAFNFNAATATQVLAELQAQRIAGRDMGDGDCDLLIHDRIELENHFKRLRREAEKREEEIAQENSLQELRESELQRQRELAQLEDRARQLREQAQAGISMGDPCDSTPEHVGHKRSFNRSEIRRGFVWAKVLDEPRFKKRWSAKAR